MLIIMKGEYETMQLFKEEGCEEEQIRVISRMLRNGKNPEEILDLCGYPLELVKKVEKKLLVSMK